MTGNVYCVGCGEVVHPEARFCQSCGGEQPLELAPAMTARPQLPAPPPAPFQPPPSVTQPPPLQTPVDFRLLVAGGLAIGAAIAAWFGENAAIHAMGYSGFGGAGWITAIVIPLGAAAKVWELLGGSK